MSSGAILPDTPNFRDLGGLPAGSGRRVRHGLFFRSPALGALSARDADALRALAPAAIVDFRGAAEASSSAALPDDLAAVRLPLPVEPSVARRLADVPAGDLTVAHVREAMLAGYAEYVTLHADRFAAFLRRAAEPTGPVVFHCTAGKDRTGFAAALLLEALGVGPDSVTADFMRTNLLWSPPDHVRARTPEVTHAVLFSVAPDFLDAALSALRKKHGSVAEFAAEALGGRPELDRLCRTALEPVT